MANAPRFGDPFGVKTWWSFLSSEQKFSVGVFSVCGFFALAFSGWYLYAHIRSPFLIRRSTLKESRAALAPKDQVEESDEVLKTKDTDRDGLNDYDELKRYGTSPYLADTDSDTLGDAEEIAQGSDPQCPKGRSCAESFEAIPSTNATAAARELLDASRVPQPQDVFGAVSSSVGSGAQDFLKNPPNPSSLTPQQIRDYLVSHNLATPSQLTDVSDDVLRQAYQAAYKEAKRMQSSSSATTTSP